MGKGMARWVLAPSFVAPGSVFHICTWAILVKYHEPGLTPSGPMVMTRLLAADIAVDEDDGDGGGDDDIDV